MLKDETVKNKLKDLVSGNVLFDEPMELHTSIGVGGKVDALVFPSNKEELSKTIAYLRYCGIPSMPIGNGTNVIVKDGGYRGALISMKRLNTVKITDQNADRASIYADAGVLLSDMVSLAARNSLSGIEFCACIPGSVGGAVKMNAGAYGGEIKDTVDTINLMNQNGEITAAGKESLKFEYRNLDLPEGMIILGASFLFRQGLPEKIQSRIAEILITRKKKHPLEYRNAGSIFKNPRGNVPAGEIIDTLGLKGIRSGNAMISEKHGNFIVNLGGARAKDIIDLIQLAKRRVMEERGVTLETEVKIIGED